MSDYDDQLEGTELVRQLRKQLKEKDAAFKEFDTELKVLRDERRTRVLGEKLTEKGLNPKVAKLVPKDVEDVDTWLTEYGDVFGITQEETETPAPEAAAQSRISNLEAKGQVGTESLQNRLASAPNQAELMSIIAAAR